MERVFCNKEGSPVCINCSSFSNSIHFQGIPIMDLGSELCDKHRVNTITDCWVSVTSGT